MMPMFSLNHTGFAIGDSKGRLKNAFMYSIYILTISLQNIVIAFTDDVEKPLKLGPPLMVLFAETITSYMFAPIGLSPHYLCIASGQGWKEKEEVEKTSSGSGLEEEGGGCPDVCELW